MKSQISNKNLADLDILDLQELSNKLKKKNLKKTL